MCTPCMYRHEELALAAPTAQSQTRVMTSTTAIERYGFGLLALLTAGSALAGCGDDSEGGGGAGAGAAGGPSTGAGDEGGGGSAGPGGAGGEGGDGGSGGDGRSIEVVATFDPAAFELPEGLAIRGDAAHVGFAFTGAIDRFALPEGTRIGYANAPPPPPNTAFMTGLTFDQGGRLYAAYVSFTPDATPGVYRADAGGGPATLWATHPQMVFPNGFAWDDDGLLYVTDSATGGIFRIDDTGTAELWMTDALLAGDPLVCGGAAEDIAVGANGLVFTGGAFYVASSDQALLARVPLEADGSAGALTVIAGPDCDGLAGIDGLTVDGVDVLAAINRSNRIVRIATSDGAIEELASGAPLDFPASLEFAGQGEGRALYVTSFALGAFLSGGDPAPALVRIGW